MQLFELQSPNGICSITLYLEQGRLFYKSFRGGVTVIEKSSIGLFTAVCDFTCGMVFKTEVRNQIDEEYCIPAFKKARCENKANEMVLTFEKDTMEMQVTVRAYDDGTAFKLTLSGDGDVVVKDEMTQYHIPEMVTNIYAQKILFSYEDNYQPVPKEDLYQNPYAFPVLLEFPHGVWALYAEAFVYGGTYGGSNLVCEKEIPLCMNLKKAPEKQNDVTGKLPFETPWRAVIAGNLGDIVTSNLLENLNPAPLHDFSYVKGGMAAWGWIVENGCACDPARIREYVDYAAKMNFDYTMIDAGWPGNIDIAEMVAYAKEKGVGIWIWEHSAAMDDPVIAEEKMKLWSEWGVSGIKIDFFESDSQERMARHCRLAELAAKYRLMLDYHGCSKPTGTSRVWPHVLTYEGVLGAEYLQNFSTFLPGGPDAAHNCTLPFTRNAVGPMDYTPLMYESFLTGTSDTHQTALSVIFTSYLQNLAERPEIVMKHPCASFLKKVKAAWDETILLEGAPANYVTMARRSGEEWFVAGICARRPRISHISLDFLDGGSYTACVYADDISGEMPMDHAIGAVEPYSREQIEELNTCFMRTCLHKHDMHRVKTYEVTVKRGDILEIPMCVNGGFAIYIKRRVSS